MRLCEHCGEPISAIHEGRWPRSKVHVTCASTSLDADGNCPHASCCCKAHRHVVPVTCCGQDMTAERIELPDGRRKFTLSCEVCGDSTVEFTRSEVVTAMFDGQMIEVGTIRVPA